MQISFEIYEEPAAFKTRSSLDCDAAKDTEKQLFRKKERYQKETPFTLFSVLKVYALLSLLSISRINLRKKELTGQLTTLHSMP